MDPMYMLKRLFSHSTEARKAQKAYYGHRADPKTDELKRQYLAESKRREADLDNLLATVPKLFPGIDREDKAATIPVGAMSVPEINASRLGKWKDKLDSHNSTPQVIIAVGIGPMQGRLMVLCTDDLTNEKVILFMEGAIRELKGL